MESLSKTIQTTLIGRGAGLVGFADLEGVSDSIKAPMRYAVSIAVALDASVIRDISHGPNVGYFEEYKRANAFLGELCRETVGIIEQQGHRAVAFEPTVDVLDYSTLTANFPHKTAATRAGLSWIGKSALLITKEYGAAVRLGTVLTDAELETGEPIDQSQCGECQECRKHCPAGAILGTNWEAGMARKTFYDAFACCKTAEQLCRRQNIDATICGICINVCPWTQKYLKGGLEITNG